LEKKIGGTVVDWLLIPIVVFLLETISQEQQRRVESEGEKASKKKNKGRARTETGRKWFRLISSYLHRHAVMSFIRPESRPNDYNTFPYIGSWPKTQSNKRGPRMKPIQTPRASLATAHDTVSPSKSSLTASWNRFVATIEILTFFPCHQSWRKTRPMNQ